MKGQAKFLVLLSLVFTMLALAEVAHVRYFQRLENLLSDWIVRTQARDLQPDPDIVIVDIDDASLERMKIVAGSWPWPRAVHGELVQGLTKQQPRAIVFDIQFSEPDTFRPESDRAFNDALGGSVPVYFPLVRQNAQADPHGIPAGKAAELLHFLPTPQAQPDARVALLPPAAIAPQHWRTGTINYLEDADGVGRRYWLYQNAYGYLMPSLPARVASDLGYAVPRQADTVLHWRGGTRAFRHIAYADLYEDFNREKPRRAADELRGKIVIVGTDAMGLNDFRATPVNSLHPAMEILATALDNLKNDRRMALAPAWFAPALTFAMLAALLAAFAYGVNALKSGAALAAVSVLLLAASWWSVAQRQMLPVLTPMMLAWLFYISCALQAYIRERRSRERAIQLFSRFVNPHVVKELIAQGGLSRAGESRQVTMLFSDIRGFTTLSEKRTPQEVVTLLNRYFTLQVEVVFRHGGSLDKFIGDCIMAFWGAPLDDPRHAENAVAAAMEMAAVLQQFKAELGEEDADFDVGIGIHTGPAVVGLIGSEQRREYTAIGDTVNLASRIEGLTKGVSRILVSEDTMLACRNAFTFTPHGSFKIKGREQDVNLYAPIFKDTP
ncbi:MAG TPA: adenylate/guanylate cyclase domain-containing protein [Burkholderiaceae bacterium]